MLQIVNIDNITPAEYNPRIISEKQFERLKLSLQDLGFVIPVLAHAKNNVIIAGHQRTKAAKAMGIKNIPVVFVDSVTTGDEIKFNQLHNAVDEIGNTEVKYTGKHGQDFVLIPSEKFEVLNYDVEYTKEICKLTVKYGNVLYAVICGGKVIIGGNYVKACQLLAQPVNASFVEPEKEKNAIKYLSGNYGEYSYNAINKKTYVQGLAQLHRNIERTDGKRTFKSTLYDHVVLPYLKKQDGLCNILDFGCGKGAYVSALSKNYNILGLEFFNNNRKAIDIAKGNRMVDDLVNWIKNKGRFDIVVCDSVLNSVDSLEAEINVLRCLNIFSNGKVFISGRPRDAIERKAKSQRSASPTLRYLQFLDKDGFTGTYREGQWYFQHFHTKEQITNLIRKAGMEPEKISWSSYSSDSFQITANKVRELSAAEVKAAIEFEFNLPLPNNESYNRHTEVLTVVMKYLYGGNADDCN